MVMPVTVHTTITFVLSTFIVSPLLWLNVSNNPSKICIPSTSYEKITTSSAYKSNKITWSTKQQQSVFPCSQLSSNLI